MEFYKYFYDGELTSISYVKLVFLQKFNYSYVILQPRSFSARINTREQ